MALNHIVASGTKPWTTSTLYSLILSSPSASAPLILDAAKAVVSVPLTNGQLLIGSTGAVPTAATLTAGTGIAVTGGAGSLTVARSYATAQSWTPVITFGGGSTGQVYADQVGTYVLDGRVFTFTIKVRFTNKGSSTGNAGIALPAGIVVTAASGFAIGIWSALTAPTDYWVSVAAEVAASGTTLELFGIDGNAGIAALDDADMTNNTLLTFSGQLIVN